MKTFDELYAELVKNRSFEFPNALMGWSQVRSGTGEGAWKLSSSGDGRIGCWPG